ncbi:MAG: MarR family winged helix-turn-helix transcriptional regulator [Desulfotomaculaceae bacterium]|nr:MarR family winged helix-turn-helix transcriptional regulator [Desulfotomaculaceae bacterium]
MNYEDLRELHDLIFGAMGLFHEKFLRQFRKRNQRYLGLKKNHTRIIAFLYQHQVLTATEMAKMLDMEKGSLTTLIVQLEELGLVMRCDDLNDRRKFLISLTDAGKAEMETTLSSSTRCMSEILSDADPDELQKFVAGLRYAVEFMEKIQVK